jgi:hypothetical protein
MYRHRQFICQKLKRLFSTSLLLWRTPIAYYTIHNRDESIETFVGSLEPFVGTLLCFGEILHRHGELIDAVSKHDLRGKKLLVLFAELNMVVDQEFERVLDPIHSARAVSVFARHR